MSHPASDAWNALDRGTQRAEVDACSERFLAYLEWLADWSDPHDSPGYHADLIAEIRKRRGEVERLRALVKAGEHGGPRYPTAGELGVCPWCRMTPHYDGCPAFTPEGVVR